MQMTSQQRRLSKNLKNIKELRTGVILTLGTNTMDRSIMI
jgi:hypothetical protein